MECDILLWDRKAGDNMSYKRTISPAEKFKLFSQNAEIFVVWKNVFKKTLFNKIIL